ncbi:MAG: hypothetical protein ABJA64_02010 [Candidatus Saccharibacteria bacterium]
MSLENPLGKINKEDLPSIDETVIPPVRNRDDHQEQFEGLIKGYDKKTAVVPRKERDDRNTEQSKFSLTTKIGGGLAVIGLLGAGFLGLKAAGGDNPNTEPKNETTTSAPATPGETQPVQKPGGSLGVEGTTFASVNTAKSKEFIQQATEPILEKDYTPEEAIVRFGELYNIYYTSGTIDSAASGIQETPESLQQGEAILDTMFNGSSIGVSDGTKRLRGLISEGLVYLNETGGAPAGKIGTYHTSYVVEGKNADGTYNVLEKVETNFHQLDDNYFTSNETGAVSHEVPRVVKISVKNGKYVLSSDLPDSQ